MLLCDITDVKPGVKLAAAIIKEDAPEVELLKPGVTLDQRLLTRLRHMGVRQIWIDHDLASDLDRTIDPRVMRTKLDLYRQFKSDLARASGNSVTDARLSQYRQTIAELVTELVSAGKIGVLTDSLFQCGGNLMTHCINVAHLSILIGLQLESYIIRERSRLSVEHARDMVTLGLGAALHDIGKIGLDGDAADGHEVFLAQSDLPSDEARAAYYEHPVRGYEMLRNSRLSASACQAVLNHHQRFDGTGWPNRTDRVKRDGAEPLAGRRIHIFTRIVAAANALDNLMRTAEGEHRPTVAALAEFAGSEYDGWFDPVVRRAALKCIPPYSVGSMVTLNNDRAGVVTRPSLVEPCRPVVRLFPVNDDAEPAHDSSDGESAAPIVDLRLNPECRIVTCAGVDVSSWYFELPAEDEAEFHQAA